MGTVPADLDSDPGNLGKPQRREDKGIAVAHFEDVFTFGQLGMREWILIVVPT